MIKHLRLFSTLLLLAVASMAWGEEVFYTLTPTTNSATNSTNYSTGYDFTIEGMTWNATGNTGMNPWRIGGKSLTNVDREIYSKTVMGSAISKVELEVGTASSITVNSLKLVVASDAEFTNTIDEVTATFKASSTITFTPTSGEEWATDAFYKFVFNVTVSGTSNKFIEFKGAKFYKKGTTPSGPIDPTVTFANNSIEVEVGKTVTNEISAPSSLSFTYSSENQNIARVNESGEVTGVAEGSTTITASWAEVTGTWNAGSKSYTVTVIPEKQAVIFEKVTSANQLVAGNEYILVAIGEGKAMGSQGSNLRNPVNVTISDDQVAITDETVAVLTLGGSSNAWTFLASDNNKYISLNSASNALHTSDEATDGALWTITDDFRLKNNKQTNYILQYNSSNPRFACYTSSQKQVYLFMKQGGTVETKADPEFSFGETTAFTVNAGKDFTAPTLTTAEGYDGTVTYSSSDEDMAVVDAATGEVVIGDKAGTVTITASAPATDNFLAGEASYTITVVKPLSIAEFVALADNTEAILKLDAAQVVYKNGDNMYVRDGSDAINLYQTSLTWELGEVVAGTLNATKDSHRNTPQAIDVTVQSIESAGTEDVVATSSTVADAKNHLNDLVTFTFNNIGVSANYYYATAGDDKVQLYNKFNVEGVDFTTLETDKEYKVTGIVILYNNTVEICPTEAITEVVDEREEAGIAFNPETLTITEGETFTQPTFVNPNSLTVTFESDHEDVAMWDDENNELVLMDGIGTAVITATFEGNDNYKPATATLTVTVKEDLNFVEVTEGCGIYQKVTSASDLEAGKRYLMVYETQDDDLNDVADVFNGVENKIGTYVVMPLISDMVDNTTGTATHPIVLQSAGSGNWYLMDGDNFLYWTSGNYLYCSDVASQAGNTWSVNFGEEGMSINNVNTRERYLQFNTSSPRFACYTGTQKNVVLYKELMVAPISVTIGTSATGADGAYYSSVYYSDKALQVPVGVECQTYKMTDGKLSVSKTYAAGSVIPADEAVVIKASDAGEVKFAVTTTTEEKDASSMLLGCDKATTISEPGYKYYKLTLNAAKEKGTAGFYFDKGVTDGSTINAAANKCYLRVPVDQTNGAKGFVFGDDTDGIEQIENGQLTIENSVVYDLSGRKLNKVSGRHGSLPLQLPKGIYIVNGKKVVVK